MEARGSPASGARTVSSHLAKTSATFNSDYSYFAKYIDRTLSVPK
jgi:hypothetical protein